MKSISIIKKFATASASICGAIAGLAVCYKAHDDLTLLFKCSAIGAAVGLATGAWLGAEGALSANRRGLGDLRSTAKGAFWGTAIGATGIVGVGTLVGVEAGYVAGLAVGYPVKTVYNAVRNYRRQPSRGLGQN